MHAFILIWFFFSRDALIKLFGTKEYIKVEKLTISIEEDHANDHEQWMVVEFMSWVTLPGKSTSGK